MRGSGHSMGSAERGTARGLTARAVMLACVALSSSFGCANRANRHADAPPINAPDPGDGGDNEGGSADSDEAWARGCLAHARHRELVEAFEDAKIPRAEFEPELFASPTSEEERYEMLALGFNIDLYPFIHGSVTFSWSPANEAIVIEGETKTTTPLDKRVPEVYLDGAYADLKSTIPELGVRLPVLLHAWLGYPAEEILVWPERVDASNPEHLKYRLVVQRAPAPEHLVDEFVARVRSSSRAHISVDVCPAFRPEEPRAPRVAAMIEGPLFPGPGSCPRDSVAPYLLRMPEREWSWGDWIAGASTARARILAYDARMASDSELFRCVVDALSATERDALTLLTLRGDALEVSLSRHPNDEARARLGECGGLEIEVGDGGARLVADLGERAARDVTLSEPLAMVEALEFTSPLQGCEPEQLAAYFGARFGLDSPSDELLTGARYFATEEEVRRTDELVTAAGLPSTPHARFPRFLSDVLETFTSSLFQELAVSLLLEDRFQQGMAFTLTGANTDIIDALDALATFMASARAEGHSYRLTSLDLKRAGESSLTLQAFAFAKDFGVKPITLPIPEPGDYRAARVALVVPNTHLERLTWEPPFDQLAACLQSHTAYRMAASVILEFSEEMGRPTSASFVYSPALTVAELTCLQGVLANAEISWEPKPTRPTHARVDLVFARMTHRPYRRFEENE